MTGANLRPRGWQTEETAVSAAGTTVARGAEKHAKQSARKMVWGRQPPPASEMRRTVSLAKRFSRKVLVPARATLTQMVDGRARGKQGAMRQTTLNITSHVEADPWVCSDKVHKARQLPEQTGCGVHDGPWNLQGRQQIKKIRKANIIFFWHNVIKIRTPK